MVGAAVMVMSVFALAPAASATVGVGVGADALTPNTAVRAGSHVALPSLYVVNTGTETVRIGIAVERLVRGSAGAPVPIGWVHVAPTSVELSPRASTYVGVTLFVPVGATSGRYRTDLVASASTRPVPGRTSARVGAAAATEVSFTIAGNAPAKAASEGPSRRWWAAVVLLFGALAAGTVWWRRSGLRLRVRVERR